MDFTFVFFTKKITRAGARGRIRQPAGRAGTALRALPSSRVGRGGGRGGGDLGFRRRLVVGLGVFDAAGGDRLHGPETLFVRVGPFWRRGVLGQPPKAEGTLPGHVRKRRQPEVVGHVRPQFGISQFGHLNGCSKGRSNETR